MTSIELDAATILGHMAIFARIKIADMAQLRDEDEVLEPPTW
jgi:hypothetical protein